MPMNSKKTRNGHEESRYSLFLKLYRQNESALFGFIVKLIPNFSVAEDIMQETLVVMWDKFDTFQEGTSFLAWSKQIARYKVMNFIRKDKDIEVVHFSEYLTDKIAEMDDGISCYETYYEAMHRCVDKLKESNKKIIHLRYIKSMKIKDIAGILGATSNTLSKQMARIHYMLRKCIDRTMQAWDLTNG
jgi:RNA polymerase sigma-70 factor (ECF subfamily)